MASLRFTPKDGPLAGFAGIRSLCSLGGSITELMQGHPQVLSPNAVTLLYVRIARTLRTIVRKTPAASPSDYSRPIRDFTLSIIGGVDDALQPLAASPLVDRYQPVVVLISFRRPASQPGCRRPDPPPNPSISTSWPFYNRDFLPWINVADDLCMGSGLDPHTIGKRRIEAHVCAHAYSEP